ncbi:MAG: FecR domain-containing protein [Candidatus Riflebacteria bacterium]|nr:FecR domain-containing protein [Candidatus Riflebacteria bacterium]
MNKRFTTSIMAVGLLFVGGGFSLFALTDLSNTELIKVTNSVEVKKGDAPSFKTVPANLQLAGSLKRLDVGDKVKTADNSGAEMVLKDTCILAVKEKTLFEVPAVAGAAAMTKLKAQSGSFLFKVVSGSDFKVQTADVIAGVKGTLFEVQIVDNIAPLIELPNLMIGVDNCGGGTSINVYEGEVELTHALTRKSRRIKAGQGLAALGPGLIKLDGSLAEGFGALRVFKPLENLKQRFGQVGQLLGSLPSSGAGIAGYRGEGLSLPLKLDGPGARMKELLQGLAPNIQERIAKVREGLSIIGNIQELHKTLQDAKGTPFVPSFEGKKYPRIAAPATIGKGEVKEAWLGGGCFVAIAPDVKCASLKIEPAGGRDADAGNAVGLPENGGEACFRVKDYLRGIEALVSCRHDAAGLTTNVSVEKGALLMRPTGESENVEVTAGHAFAITKAADGSLLKPSPAPRSLIVPELSQHVFAADADVAQQRKAHEAKQAEARQKIMDKGAEVLKSPGLMKEKKDEVKNKLRGLLKFGQ